MAGLLREKALCAIITRVFIRTQRPRHGGVCALCGAGEGGFYAERREKHRRDPFAPAAHAAAKAEDAAGKPGLPRLLRPQGRGRAGKKEALRLLFCFYGYFKHDIRYNQ